MGSRDWFQPPPLPSDTRRHPLRISAFVQPALAACPYGTEAGTEAGRAGPRTLALEENVVGIVSSSSISESDAAEATLLLRDNLRGASQAKLGVFCNGKPLHEITKSA